MIKSNILKVLIIIAITLAVYVLWQVRLEPVYAKILSGGTNVILSIVKTDTKIEVEKENDSYQFRVHTLIDSRKGSYPQLFGSLLQPFVIILSWQLFLFFVIRPKLAMKIMGVNLGIFYVMHMLFLILLTGYYTSELQKYIYVMMMDSFYIIAIVLVIKDTMRYTVFQKAIS